MPIRISGKPVLMAVIVLTAFPARGADLTPTSTVVASSANPSVFGQAVALTATVSPMGGAPSASGSVTFYDGTTILGIRKLANGQAVLSTVLLPAGNLSVRAYYAGDAIHASSSSSVLAQQVHTVPGNGFAPPVHYSGDIEGDAIAVGDFNGDGKADLAIATFIPAILRVLLGNGDGTFQAPVDYPTGGSAGQQSIAIGDFNGDGIADIAVACSFGSTVAIFLGNGDGTFQPGVNYPADQFVEAVAIGDFNGDGIADLVTANRDDSTVSVYLGNGDGTFQPRVSYPAGVDPYSIVVGDFNNDGKADLAALNWDGTLNVFSGNGDGTFQPRRTYFTNASFFNCIVAADFNGDGNTDLAVSGDEGTIQVWLGNGDGTFRASASYSGLYGVYSLAVSDFNGDGKLDLAQVDSLGEVILLLGNGDGTFQLASVGTGGNNLTNSLAVGDFNGDGRADLVLGFESGVDIVLGRLGQTSATTLTSSANPAVYGQSVTLTASVSPSIATGTVTFYDGQAALGTSPVANGQATLATASLKLLQHVLTAVYSGDQSYESSISPALVQVVNQAATAITLTSSMNPSNSGESLTLTATVWQSGATGMIEFLDGSVPIGARPVSGGMAALLTATLSAGSHSLTAIYQGDANYLPSTSQALTETVTAGTQTTTTMTSSSGRSTLGGSVTFTVTVSPAASSGSVTFYDGVAVLGTEVVSGGQAVLTTNLLPAGVRSIRAFYGGSAGLMPSASSATAVTVSTTPVNRFPVPVTYPLGAGVNSVAAGDFNGDGKADLAAVTSSGVSILLGNGDGSFQAAVNYPINGNTVAVAVGDFNGDGNADLAAINFSGTVGILLGNGDGTFQKAVNYSAGPNPRSVMVGDFNGDGKADLALNTGYVLLGNGDGSFQPPLPWLNGVVAVGDFNGDGKPDFIDAGGVVRLGNNDGTFAVGSTLPVSPGYVAIGDFNGDGKADVAVILHVPPPMTGYGPPNYGYDMLTVYPGQGNGSFGPPVTVASGSYDRYPGVIVVGDFNGDGNADLALVNGAAVLVFPGNGDGTFGAAFPFSTTSGATSNSVVVAPFTGDGKTDIAYVGASAVNVLLGETIPAGVTTLQSSPNPSMYGQSITVTATVTPSTATGNVSFYVGTILWATETLQGGQASLVINGLSLGSYSLTALYSGDANFAPSLSSAVVQSVITGASQVTLTSSANPAAAGESVLLTATLSGLVATGTVTFNDGATVLGVGTVNGQKAFLLISTLAIGTHSLTAAYSGDTNNAPVASSVLIQTIHQGSSATVSLTSSRSPATYGQSVTLMASVSPPDATGTVTFYDGMTVLGSSRLNAGQAGLTTNLLAAGTRSLAIYYSGDGSYTPGASSVLSQVVRPVAANSFLAPISQIVADGGNSILVEDFNGDGKPDIIVFGTSHANVLLGNGDGTFQLPATTDFGGTFNNLFGAAADLNGDGKTDLVIGTVVSPFGGIGVLLGNGDGTFQTPVFYGPFSSPRLVAVADFNGDGRADIVVGDYSFPATVSVLLGNGDGTFEAPITSIQGNEPQSMAVGDFNGDGLADVAIINGNGNTISILLGKGDGTFQQALNFNTVAAPKSIALGDFNGDVKTDLAIATSDGSVSLLLGNGDGTFQNAVSYRAGDASLNGQAIGIAVGDFNGDGNADLAVTNPLGVSVLLGKGDGTFEEPTYYGSGSTTIAVADLNGDGRSDIATGSVSVLLGSVTSVPSLASNGVLNAAALYPTYGFGSLVGPGSLAKVYGNFLLDAPVAATGSPLPTKLSGLSVNFAGGFAAPLLSASAGQVTFQVPWELAGQSQTGLSVTVNGQTSATETLNLQPFSPGIFTADGSGSGQGAIFDLSNRLVDVANPATAGSTVVQIYCTGLGPVSNQPTSGTYALGSPSSLTTTLPQVEFGSDYASVFFSGLVPGLVGVYQVNALVPASQALNPPGPTVPVTITAGSMRSNSVTIAVR